MTALRLARATMVLSAMASSGAVRFDIEEPVTTGPVSTEKVADGANALARLRATENCRVADEINARVPKRWRLKRKTR